jgi:hypothetical protein
VTFTDGVTPLGSVGLASGLATFTTATLSTGPHTITATYSGDTNFAGAADTKSQIVAAAGTTTFLAGTPNPGIFGQSVTFTATTVAVAPGAGTPAGIVSFFDGGTPLGSASLDGSGVATLSTTSLVLGSQNITAVYAGSTSFTGSTGTFSQTVTAGTTTALTAVPNPSAFAQAVTFTASVTPATPGTPTGTVTFKDGASTLGVVTLSSGTATFTTSALAPGPHSVTAVYSGDSIFTGSTSTILVQSVGHIGSTTALVSTPNPSAAGQIVTFTATVAPSGGPGTPTGAITFKDGATALGTGTLSPAGVATLAISSLTVGSHSITAAYGGDVNFSASTSPVLNQAVNVPADSIKLRALQIQVSKLEAQGSGQATSGAIGDAISEGFSGNGPPISASDNGVHFNFTADAPEHEKTHTFDERAGNAFAAVGHVGPPILKAPPRVAPKEWLLWADVRGANWNTNQQTGDIRGGQTNGLVGLTHKLTADLLIGAFGGMEIFDYNSQVLAGHLKGTGWTAGGYLGWRLLPGVRFEAGGAYSGIGYDGAAGAATGSFPGQRWLATAALVATLKTMPGFEIESSARVYGLWEHEDAYTDSLGTMQEDRNFSTGRASAGTKLAYPWIWSATTTVAPYVGGYADYYFNRDDATVPVAAPLLLPTEFIHGWSGRVTSGIAVKTGSGAQFTVGGELGGLGSNQFTTWTARGRATLPF